jgi:oxygen-independent coproporphyrinogen-3 oxidase
MAGLYIHIPFCRQACRYCDFYFTVSLKYLDQYISSLIGELTSRKGTSAKEEISTVYFGGGTPSVLSAEQLLAIMQGIENSYNLKPGAEITLEANPDDLNEGYLKFLRKAGFNRLSIGVQSFQESQLEIMRRSHNAVQAVESLKMAGEAGFNNISIDLIYGLPGLSLQEWEENILKAMEQPVQHISAYHLIYEPGTVFYHWRRRGSLIELSEQASIDQYYLLRKVTAERGFEHYEISNFAREGFRSVHNSTYWKGLPYLGFGPSAHSYDGHSRRWNISSLKKYIERTERGEPYYETEILTAKDKYHDYLITSLRTVEGVNIKYVRQTFGTAMAEDLLQRAQSYIESNDLIVGKEEILMMTPEGWLKSDLIIGDLMIA